MKRNLLKVAVFLFAAVVSVGAMAQTVALQEPKKEAADTYEKVADKYQLVNQWYRSATGANYSPTDIGGANTVRGMVAKDGKMYFCYRSGNVGENSIIVVDGETGLYEKTISLSSDAFVSETTNAETGELVRANTVTLPNNDIKVDTEGNFLVGCCATSNTQPVHIYKVDIETGDCEELINEVLADNPEFATIEFRCDAFGVYGDVNGSAVVMVANTKSFTAFRWVIEDGVAGKAELVTLADADGDGAIAKNGDAAQIMPISEDLFYVDGMDTYPTLYQYDGNGKAAVMESFYSEETGDGLPILKTFNTNNNGIKDFELVNAEGETEFFLCCAACNNAGTPKHSFAIVKYADEMMSFQTAELIYQFPLAGFGNVSLAYRTAPAFVEENPNNPNAADIYVYAGENGFARYTFSCDGADIDQDQDVENGEMVGVENVTVANVYTEGGLVVAEGEFEIFTVTGQNVTAQNGNLAQGAYIVKAANATAKVIVK